MKKYFTVLALFVLSGQVHAAKCGELSFEELIASTQRGTVAQAIACPEEKIVELPQTPGPIECREITLVALTNLKNSQKKNESFQALMKISQNFKCTDDVLENARSGLQKASQDNLKAAVKNWSGY